MRYLTYIEYVSLGGTLEETAFNRYEFMAEKEIDRETFNRIRALNEAPGAVKMLTNELIGINAQIDMSKQKVTSESVGKWSKSYADTGKEDYEKGKTALIISYLSGETDGNGIPLLYRGC